MSKFRSRPVEIEAALFDGQRVGEPDPANPGKVLARTCPEWFPAVIQQRAPGGPDWKHGSVSCMGDKVYLANLFGPDVCTNTVFPGNMIVRMPNGDLEPCTWDDFHAQFEPEPFALSQSDGVGARYGASANGEGVPGTYAWFTEKDAAEGYLNEFDVYGEVWDLVTGLQVR